MNGLAFYGGRLVITPGPDADREDVDEFKASVKFFQQGKSDAVLAEVVALAKLLEPILGIEAQHD